MSWEEFKDSSYVEPETGMYIVNGDELASSEEELADLYRRYRASFEQGIGSSQDPLTINVVGGAWDRWTGSAAQNISYCISNKAFSASRKAQVVAAMNAATADWEGAGNLNFVYDSSQDGSCTNRNNNVVFNVTSVCRGQYLARAFFPSDSRRSREVIIDCTSFGTIAPWTLAGVLRHELGHTLGFRHEHVWATDGGSLVCPEGGSYEHLNPYDAESVMHYPQCNGTQDGDLVLTASDRDGARIAYP